jgi:hypothetical protein
LKTGQHVKSPDATPMANLLLNVMKAVDVPQDKIGDSTGPIVGV